MPVNWRAVLHAISGTRQEGAAFAGRLPEARSNRRSLPTGSALGLRVIYKGHPDTARRRARKRSSERGAGGQETEETRVHDDATAVQARFAVAFINSEQYRPTTARNNEARNALLSAERAQLVAARLFRADDDDSVARADDKAKHGTAVAVCATKHQHAVPPHHAASTTFSARTYYTHKQRARTSCGRALTAAIGVAHKCPSAADRQARRACYRR